MAPAPIPTTTHSTPCSRRRRSLYAEHELTPWLQVTGAAWPPELEERLEARGWQTRIDRTLLLGGPLSEPADTRNVVVEQEPSAAWIAAWWKADPRGGARELEVVSALLTRIENAAFARAIEGKTVVGVGVGVVVGEMLVLECLATVAGSRRQGVATRAISALAGWASERGATQTLLAVQERTRSPSPCTTRSDSSPSGRMRTPARLDNDDLPASEGRGHGEPHAKRAVTEA